MKKWVSMLALSGLLAAPGAGAWGTDGHRAVGAIADRLIKDSNAQRRVAALLLPGESLEKISVWLDCAKGTQCGPRTAEMIAYTSANPGHAQYHYANLPFQNPRYRDGDVGTARDDIVQTLRQAIVVLQGKADGAANPHHFTPRQALILVTHLAADIHQPLHVGVPYVGKSGAFVVPRTRRQVDGVNIFDTRGGNDLLVDHAAADGAAQADDAARADNTGSPDGAAQAGAFALVDNVARADGAVQADAATRIDNLARVDNSVQLVNFAWTGNAAQFGDSARVGNAARVGLPARVDSVAWTDHAARFGNAAPGAAWSFHAYWDITTVDNAMAASGARTPERFAQIAIAGRPVIDGNSGEPVSWPYQWADETLHVSALAHAGLAPGRAGEQLGRNGERYPVWALTLPEDYAARSSALANTQLVRSGYRLAALLRAIWP